MSKPTFSVIIPAYEAAETIGRALQSVLVQSYPAHEVIIVDDGSTDALQEAIAGFTGKIKYIRQANAGVSAARNAGAQAATGEWLAFLDADDWYFPDRLRWHAEWIERDLGLDFLTGDYEYRRPDGSLISRSMEISEAGRTLMDMANGQREVVMEGAIISKFVENHFGDTHTLSLPRVTFLELGGYPIGRSVCEDVTFLIRLCDRSKRIGVICEPMGIYLIHGASATRANPLQAQFSNVETLKILKPTIKQFSGGIRRGFFARLRHARLNLAYALLRNNRKREALFAVLPSLLESPGLPSFRNVASILKGSSKKAQHA